MASTTPHPTASSSAARGRTERDEFPHRYTAAMANDLEVRWQREWAARDTYRAPNPGESGFDASKPKFYCLDMFPYPSGAGLHVGHPEGYTATDIICRYKRHRGFNVLHPMGWDAFGLPAEQYAIATNVHPSITTRKAIDTFRAQLQRFGFSYDWSREFATIDEDYYKWTQWIFLRMYDSWFDAAQRKARPIAALIAEYESGKRPVGINSAAGEYSQAQKAQAFGSWTTLSAQDQRRIIDSYRLAYIAEQTVNWCPKLGTVLANEEVIDGKSERGGFPVLRRPLRQWMFRITAYADRLLEDLSLVKWPESTQTQQAEWIGRSEGAEIEFSIDWPTAHSSQLTALRVFTTRPDTIFGATFMVVAPEHPLVEHILTQPMKETDVAKLRAYVQAARNRSDVDRMAESKEKTGVFTGAYAINPAIDSENPLWPNQHRIPIWVADYVLMGYGHGAIMAVPSHDQRDLEFARKFDIPTQNVVLPPDGWLREHVSTARTEKTIEELRDLYRVTSVYFGDDAFPGDGTAINSSNAEVSLDGLATAQAKQRIIEWLEKSGRGTRKVNYKLRDWLFSRQRYWGEPFPIVFDEAGNHYAVSESALPVKLPPLEDFKPVESDDPQPLLAKATDWANTTAGAAGVSPSLLPPNTPVRRETNTMPNWAGSCWYYLRFCDPKNNRRFMSREAERYWMVSAKAGGKPHAGGIDLYIGGNEHAVLHLLYARFWHKVLFDLGEVSTPEPFGKLFHQGMITSWAYQRDDGSLVAVDAVEKRGEDAFIESATGKSVKQIIAKMSKSLKNVQNPDDVIAQYGADTFRLYEMFMGPLEASKPWNPRDIAGPFNFLQRIWRLAIDEQTGALKLRANTDAEIEKKLHRLTAKVGDDIDRLALNTAIAAMMEFLKSANAPADGGGALTKDQLSRLIIVLSPFAPHIAEELWSRLGQSGSVTSAPWPAVDPAMLRDDEIELPVQILGKVRGKVKVPAGANADAVKAFALADPKIAPLLAGKSISNVIVVPGKIINIIAG